nr:uncharacterized protein LOC113395051 [Vanessa tameamea]
MNTSMEGFCSTLIVLLALIETIKSNTNETSSAEERKGRVNGRIVKLYSGAKPNPILCLEEGFKADPVDCTVFYRCTKSFKEKYTVFKFQCGPGTVYDPETEVCNHPRNTKRSECGGFNPPIMQESENEIEENQELPSPINSTLPVYTSHIESKNVTTSAPVFTTQKIEQFTDHKPSAPVSYPTLTTTEREYVDNSNNFVSYPWTNSKNKTQHLLVPFTTVPPNQENSFSCTSDGFIGDSDNCRKFYRCVSDSRGGFLRYEFMCSESTIWDDNIQSCNHAWAVRNKRCGRGDFEIKNDNVNSVQSLNEPNQQKENNFEIKEKEGHVYDNNDVFNGDNIQFGSKLNNEKPNTIKQNHNTIITSVNQEESSNKLQDKINDKYNEPEIEVHNDVVNEISQYSTSSDASYNFQENTATIDTRKNIQCTQSGFMADTVDCKKFYRCVDNGKGSFTKYEFSCSQETVWDSKLEACNHAWAVEDGGKCGGKLSDGNSNTEVSTKTPITASTDSAVEEENDFGYVSQSNKPHEQTTSSTILTTISLLSTTDISKVISTECTSSGFYGDVSDCQKFYRCIDNDKGSFTKYDYKCGEGTLWDQNIEACNHAWAVKSCNQTIITNTTQETGAYDTGITTTVSYIQPTVEKDNENSNFDSGYNNEQSITTLKPDKELLVTTTKNPQIQNCQSSGFIGDAKDCKKFYRCVDNGDGSFTRHEFSCGDGTVWDSEIEACNHAWAVKKCGGNIDLKEDVTSPVTEYDLNNGYSTHNYNNYDTLSTPQHSSMDLQTTTKQTILLSNHSECETNGFMGDKLDCKKFYRCVDDGSGKYTRYEFSCGEGTVWDPKIQACNHAWAVEECGSSMSISTTHNINDVSVRPSAVTTQENENGYVHTTQSTTKLDSMMSITTVRSSTSMATVINNKPECQSSGFMGDPINCKKFYRCVDNGDGGFTQHEFLCGEGTAWDPTIEACNHENAVKHCGENSGSQFEETTPSTQTQTSTTTSSSSYIVTQSQQSQTPIYSSTLSTTSLMDGNSMTPEDKECTSEGFFANQYNCKQFYRCVNNGKGGYTKYEFSCGDGTIWVQEIQACDHDTDAINCSYSSSIATTEKQEINSSNEQNEQVSESQLSTTESTTSSPTTENIKPITENTKPINQDVCTQEGYYGNTEDCMKFYRCVGNDKGDYTKYDYICGDGTIWDQDIIACNHPQDVRNPSCKSDHENLSTTTSSNPQYTSDNNVKPETTSSDPLTTSSVSSSNSNETNTTCSDNAEHSENGNITCTKAGFYADPSDCKKFYRCVDWDSNGEKFSIFHFECGEGTIWDPSLETCNHIDSVYPPRTCNGTIPPKENIPESSSTTEKITTTNIDETSSSESITQESTTQQISTTQQPLTTQQPSTTKQPSTTQEPSTTQPSTTESSTTETSTTITTREPDQTTSQTSQEQTTKSTTNPTTETTVTESGSTEQTSTSDQVITSTQPLTTEENTSPTETQSSTTEASTTENQSQSSTESNTPNEECPETDEDQYLLVCPTSFKRHPKYCNLFYQCTEDNNTHEIKVATFNCPNNTIYDESKVQCVEENQSDKKCNGQMARKHRVKRLGIADNEPIVVSKESMACPRVGHFPFEKHEECSAALLKCELTKSGKLRGYVYQCPEGFVYWSISRKCEPLRKLRECKKPSNAWNKRNDIPVEKYNVAT